MYKLRLDHDSLLKSIALVCYKLNDGLSKHDIYDYFQPALDRYDGDFIDFCIEFGIENGWLVKSDRNRHLLTAIGREFISSQFTT